MLPQRQLSIGMVVEKAIAVGCWVLVLVSVQPWVRPLEGPGNAVAVSVDRNTGKGVLIAAVFMVAVALSGPGFRARFPPTYLLYLVYAAAAASAALLLAQPVPPLLRVIRLALALAVPLLLWTRLGSDPVMFIRTHLLGYVLLALVVLAGLLLEPGTAWTTSASFGPPGRLQGVFLPMLPTRVGEIGAVIVGLAVIALAFRRTRIPVGAALIVIGLSLVVMSRTRTAAAALLIGLIVAFLLTSHSGRGLWGLIAIAGVIVTAAPFFKTVWTWALRQQSAQELSSVTGRTRAWTAIVQQEIPLQTVLLGHGLGNKNVMLRRGEGDFAAMAIDNSWLSLYWETGLMGTALVALALVATWVAVLRVPTPYVRAAASFLIVYVTISSVSETGLSDLSSLTLLMVVAGGAAYADRLRTGRHPPLPETHCSRAALAPVSE